MKAIKWQVVPWADGGAQVNPQDLQVKCGSNTYIPGFRFFVNNVSFSLYYSQANKR